MALATVDDLEDRLGRELTESEAARADAILDDVSAAVILYTGQTFTEATTTIRLKVKYGVVRLPQRPVTEVDAVEDLNGNDVTFEWDTRDRIDVTISGWLNSFEMEPYRLPQRYVNVTYTHGYATVPDAIVGVVCSIALRTLGQSPTDGAVVSESIDDYSYRIGAAGAAGAYGLLQDERESLNRYRRAGGSMSLALP